MHAQDKYVANIEIVRCLKQTHHWEIRINSNNQKLNILQKIGIMRRRVNLDLPGFPSRTPTTRGVKKWVQNECEGHYPNQNPNPNCNTSKP